MHASFELHNSLEHTGNSSTLHELDLSVVLEPHAQSVRRSGGGPFFGRRIFGAELKAFNFGAPLAKTIARALVGVAIDLDTNIFVRQLDIKFGSDTTPSVTWLLGDIPSYWLATTTSVTADSRQYLLRYTVRVAEGLDPSHLPGPLSISPSTPLTELAESIAYKLLTTRI